MHHREKNITKCACLIAIIAIGCFAGACKKKYDPPHSDTDLGYLVVEGLINSGQGPTNIKLSRTIRLDTSYSSYELNAFVRVEGEHNNFFPLAEKGKGLYSISQLHLNDNEKYRLYIRTAGGSIYVSDYAPVLRTPPIDSISWEREEGLKLYANTHSLQNKTINYRWAFEETWEFYSRYRSQLQFLFNPVNGDVAAIRPRPDSVADKMFFCWRTEESSSILQGSATQLSRDTIHIPITTIPAASWKLSVLYSINVRQYAISQPEYEFWQRMKKNTEQIGTIFDPQPSALTTNLHCLTNPGEIVIGFIGVADEQQKRIFIKNSEVPGWNYASLCELALIELKPELLNQFRDAIPLFYEFDPVENKNKLAITSPECGDCTTRGVNIKPSFWP